MDGRVEDVDEGHVRRLSVGTNQRWLVPTVSGDDASRPSACPSVRSRHRPPAANLSHGSPDRLRALPSWLLSEAARRGHHAGDRGLRRRGAAQAALHRARRAVGDRPGQPGGARPPPVDRPQEHGRGDQRPRGGGPRRAHARRAGPPPQRRPPDAGRPAALERLNARADAAQDALLAALSEDERRELERLLALVISRSD